MDLNTMYLMGVLALCIPIVVLILTRCILYLISWYLSRKYSIKLKVNRIGFFSINQIILSLPQIGVNVEIECIGLSTKLVNQKYASLLVIKLSDVRFEGDLISALKSINGFQSQPNPLNTDKRVSKKIPTKLLLFLNFLRSLSRLRFISICLHNTSLMQLGLINESVINECLFHSTVQMIQIYLTTARNNRLTLITNFDGISLKLLKHVQKDKGETCLAQVSLSLLCSLRIEESHQISTEVVVSQPQLILYDISPVLKTRKGSKKVRSDSSEGLLQKILKNKLNLKFMKCATFKIDNTSIKLVRESGKKALAININSIDADFTKTNSSEFESRLIVSSMVMNDTKAMVSSLNRINLIAKFEREKSIQQKLQLFIVSELSSCHIIYNDEEFSYWIDLILKSYGSKSDSILNDSKQNTSISNNFSKDLPKFSASLDINDISFSVKPVSVANPMVTYGLSHAKFGYVLNSDPLFREMSFELLLETLWCWNGDRELRPANPNSLKKYHQKHVPLFTSMLFLKCRHMNLSELRVHCVMDGIQISLDYFIHLLNQYDFKRYSQSESSINTNLFSTSIQINLSSVNLFTSDLMLRIDSATTDSNASKLTSSINGLALSAMYAPSATLSCLRAAELTQHRIIYLSVVRLNMNYDTHETTISLTEEVFIRWNPSFHLTLIDLYEEFLSKVVNKTNNAVESLSSNVSVHIKLDGRISIGLLLTNSGNTMAFETEYLSVSIHSSNKISSKCEHLSLHFDDNQIMTLENISINQFSESDSNSVINRKKYTNPLLETKRNKLIWISIENVIISFPYLYNFAEIFNEKFITIVKWLRQLHKTTKDETPKTKTSLSPDIYFKIGTASMEVADDPFEVRLSDNYELLEDEHNESHKRWQMLSEKIEERKRKNILLPASKLKELHNAFAKQNAKTYIERHKKLYDSSPMRTRLFCVKIEGLELEIVCDSSYNTYEQMVNILKRIDTESPFPEDIRFNTIWCRRINGCINNGVVSLRDFPHPMTEARDLRFRGTVLGAEQEASNRAKRTCFIDIGSTFQPISIERSMTTMKIYHDLIFDVSNLSYTHGACWEPVLQQLSLSFELIFRPSLDPSPSLSWWDKMRFLFHGPVVIISEQLSILFHASLDPYNSTELIEIGLYKSSLEWLTGKIIMRGNLDLLVHTASKYDECRIVHLPNVSVYINLNWVCFGHKNDHHSVMPCAADKVPEYSSNQVHDSYRNFRSHNLNVSASLETKDIISGNPQQMEIPSVLIYNSTLRWLENKMFMIAGIPRLTRRGKYFDNVKPRKQPFGRVFKSIRVTIYLHKFKISYWSSFSKQRGFEIISSNLTHSAEHLQSFIPINDNLKHRPKPIWDLLYMNSELSDVEIFLFKGTGIETTINEENWSGERQYFMSLKKVSYNRETKSPSNVRESDSEVPTHRLVVHGLRGAWTKDNRDVAFGLFDSYIKTQLLKRNLSTDALRAFKVDGQSVNSPKKRNSQQSVTTSPASTISKGHAAHMLQKLISEAENSNVVYTEDIENAVTTESSQLYGVEACQTQDVLQHNWLIELINSQVVLRGCETDGYVIVSAAKAQILQRIHRPVWKNRTLYSKTTWQGILECMQYYATVDDGGVQGDDITWLSLDNIEERNNRDIVELPDLVGSGQSVGGVVSSEVGSASETSGGSSTIQLQRIVSRCNCQFFYASYGENVDANEYEEVPPLPHNDLLPLEPWDREIAVDTFTLTHHDLEISTNSQQFSMIMDIVNNLLLYVEPHQKEVYEKQQSIRFQMQLSSIEEQREPISQLQDKVRSLVAKIKRMERESYGLHKALDEERGSGSQLEQKLICDAQHIEFEMDESKEQLNIFSEDLTIMINCFKEAQLSASKTKERQVAAQEAGGFVFANVIRRNEVCFKHAVWRLTDADGQLGLADLVLSNFLYTKISKNDDSVEHSFELGFIHCSNLLPNQVYKDVIQLTELQPNIPLDRQIALRIFCRERAPVGGISVKEHLEVNVIPLTLGLTYAFFKNMLKFFFPDRLSEQTHSETKDENENKTNKKKTNLKREESTQSIASNGTNSTVTSSGTSKSMSTSSTATSTLQITKDNLHIEKMRERAQKNQTFVYIKIPEVPIRISYKGNKGKNLEDLHNVSITLPTIEYHNRTWTWLDLFMALKNDSKRVLLSQALKHKFHISTKSKSIPVESEQNKSSVQPQEEDEDKARLLLGNIAVPNTKGGKSSKGLSLFSHKKNN